MTTVRTSTAGEARICPHCKEMILKSAASCPVCRHLLRFNAVGASPRPAPTECPLSVKGTIRHPGVGGPLEYSVLLEVHDNVGKMISRQVVGIGAFHHAETRTFSLRVEVSSGRSAVV